MVTKEKIPEIKKLQAACEKEGGFQLKLNFDMLANRSEDSNEDFFYYEDGELVGFLGSYYFGNQIELCGMVHPNYRRKGIFSKLLEIGIREAKKRNCKVILLNAPTESQSAKGFLKNIPCIFSFAEYQMKWQDTALAEDTTVNIRPSLTNEDFEAEIQLDISCFGVSENEAREHNQEIRRNNSEQNFIIETEEKYAGKIRISELNGEAWIYGFSVFPELQGKGIGRKALSKVVRMESQKGLPIFLEVEVENTHALKLYESCGFRRYHSQDYYKYLD